MKKIVLSLLFLSLSFSSIKAQESLTYQQPTKEILDLAIAPLPPGTSVDGKGENAFLSYKSRYKSIAELSEKELRLA
ncbi:MAG: hypothetical protein RR668_07655, partial [Algoriella sp.]